MSGTRASRRRFIGATGLALSAPLAGLGGAVVEGATSMGPSPEDLAAVRLLTRGRMISLSQLATTGDRRVVSYGFGTEDEITIADDGRTAIAFVPCTVVFETLIGPDCPLLEMAREQGGGVMRHSERGVAEYRCMKDSGVWTVRHEAYRTLARPGGP